ncbi:glycoside hydrolase family 36 protein [uncultured Paraglaciecola sp.]|uniref:glycoside hydrolase family 36 protein n=1 Tax=uncultured Paraglaciecola sp. TaxID=1765024 RepID=UPI0030D815BD|tara:strand:- start:182455 stop:184575 length:2121 start_codon:yes stop_codon:yes gene_type:complete
MNIKFRKKIAIALCSLGFVSGLFGCSHTVSQATIQPAQEEVIYAIQSASVAVEFDKNLHSRMVSKLASTPQILGSFQASEYVILESGSVVSDFEFISAKETKINTELGVGTQFSLVGQASSGLQKITNVSRFARFPTMLFFNITYNNTSGKPIKITKWVNNHYSLDVKADSPSNIADFWSYQGASFADRRDWVMPLTPGFSQHNYMGMNASDYGSGTAISDVWRQDVGIAVGHSEVDPKLVSIPVSFPEGSRAAQLHIELEKTLLLLPGESTQTIETFVNLHTGDYYATLKNYRNTMADKGLKIDDIPDSAYESIWCAWGYERDFSVDEVLATLPKAKEMGLKWAVLDDGWQTAEGDWYLHPDKFPNGDADMQAFVKEINDQGLKAKLWWAPLAVDPGTDLLHEHSDMLLLDEWGAVHDVTWWNSFYLCPAYEGTLEYTKELVKKMMGTWGYSGLKIDGQHLNGVPPCYNPKHNHKSPEESVEKLAEFWKMVYDTALEIDKEAVVEICPCGTSYAFHNLPYMNQAVSSDPLTSWQVRLKGKTLKGLMGESAPYYGDHVELSDNASDFASSMGIGAVVGTKFTIPSDNKAAEAFLLSTEQEQEWTKWIGLYNTKMLPKGEYLGELYDIGFDLPEAHAIAKDDRLYYGFYAEKWDEKLELRGLKAQQYQVFDYINNKNLGTVTGPLAKLPAKFEDYLLLELIPLANAK